MSAGVSDQRMKGQGNQVSNGSKEQIGAGEGAAAGSEEFEPWRTQQQQQNSAAHTAYGASVPISTATDIYNMSTAGYYGSGGTYPYQAYGDGTWSNGTDVTFLSSYPPQDYSMDGMFGPSPTFSTAAFQAGHPSSFNYFPSHSNGGDFNTWGNQLGGQQQQQQQRKYEDYYRDPQQNIYTQPLPQDNSLKAVEHAMQNLELKSSSDSKDLGQKKTTWASIASQPAKPQLPVQSQGLKKKGPGMPPGPMVPGKHNIDIGTWESNKSAPPPPPQIPLPPQPKTTVPPPGQMRPAWAGPPPPRQPLPAPHQQPPPRGPQHPMPPAFQQPTMMPPATQMPPPTTLTQGMMPAPQVHQMIIPPNAAQTAPPPITHPVLDELKVKNDYNPTEFELSAPNARFFVIKSYSEDDIHRSIKYEIWCSTEHGNKRLDQAYREREGNGCVHLFFSVNGSGHFCGMAQMVSAVDYNSNSSVWSQDKWKGQFKVRWIYVKDVPNVQLRHIRLENNDNKPVTNSRDAQEIPHPRGLQVLRIMHSYRHSTSIFDDFIHYEKRQEEEDTRKVPPHKEGQHEGGGHQNNRNEQQHQRGGGEHLHRGGGGRNHHDGGDRNDERHRRPDREGHHGGHRERGGRGGRGGARN